jgi:hypothetical protein
MKKYRKISSVLLGIWFFMFLGSCVQPPLATNDPESKLSRISPPFIPTVTSNFPLTYSPKLVPYGNIKFFDKLTSIPCIWNGGANDKASINFPKTYALNDRVIFLFGEIGGYQKGRRSLLLRSFDEGKNWNEVQKPKLRSFVLSLYFLNENLGWSSIMEGTEGPEELTIYKSTDSGLNWNEISTLDNKGDSASAAVEMTFQDEKNGKIVFPRPFEENRFIVYRTKDGGKNWQEAESIPTNQYKTPDDKISKGFDMSEWKVEKTKNSNELKISRLLSKDQNWEEMVLIADKFQVKNGCVTYSAP